MSDLDRDVVIAIKTFERPESLKDLLVSIRQFYPNIHIKVADDSKQPHAQKIVNSFMNTEYIFLDFDVGVSVGRNALLARIKSKYFVLCDDDFLFYKMTRLETFKMILDGGGVDLVGGCVMDQSDTGKFDRPNMYAGHLVLDLDRNLRLETIKSASPSVRCDIVANWFMADTVAVRGKTGGWDPKLKIEEHTDFFWRAKASGLRVAFTPDVSVNHTLADNRRYHYFRIGRKNKYYLSYFKKLGIQSFTDRWETVTLNDLSPFWVRFIFQQKCLPRCVIQKWKYLTGKGAGIKGLKDWVRTFIFEQKCVPFFILRHRKREGATPRINQNKNGHI